MAPVFGVRAALVAAALMASAAAVPGPGRGADAVGVPLLRDLAHLEDELAAAVAGQQTVVARYFLNG